MAKLTKRIENQLDTIFLELNVLRDYLIKVHDDPYDRSIDWQLLQVENARMCLENLIFVEDK